MLKSHRSNRVVAAGFGGRLQCLALTMCRHSRGAVCADTARSGIENILEDKFTGGRQWCNRFAMQVSKLNK